METVITFLLPVLTQILGATGVIPPNLQALVTTTANAIPILINSLIASKGSPSNEELAILRTIKTEIDGLKTAGVLFTLNQANEINALDQSISDAITAYEASLVTTDPSNLKPLPENL